MFINSIIWEIDEYYFRYIYLFAAEKVCEFGSLGVWEFGSLGVWEFES